MLFMILLEKQVQLSKKKVCLEININYLYRCHSWKFPDKIATDIDIKELLQRYQYGKNETDNQVSHIVLFEIIIDR
jgi:hypothetical protein